MGRIFREKLVVGIPGVGLADRPGPEYRQNPAPVGFGPELV
jgi:hypothetical protein